MHAAAVQLVKHFEGLRLRAYSDSGGKVTIGYGHCGSEVKLGDVWSVQQAEDALQVDLDSAESAVKSSVKVPLNENQLSALISFTFNVGAFNFRRSGLLKLLNQSNYKAAADHILLWNKIGLYVSPGLTNRREAEKALFETKVIE